MFKYLIWNYFVRVTFLYSLSGFIFTAHAETILWSELGPVVQARVHQQHKKMKLYASDADQFKLFLENLSDPIPKMKLLLGVLPKTTVELLMAVSKRGLNLKEAEKMADYLKGVVDDFRFSNAAAFDENTSHIIGREWSEIDYSGESMTWQKQKSKYRPYGIVHFKSLDCLKGFISVESRLPYFKKIYMPRNVEAKQD